MRLRDAFRTLPVLFLVFALAACGGSFRTGYDAPARAESWRITDVTVTVPPTLTVSEDEVLPPHADIVWREDPPGDRHAQVAALMENAIRQGAAGRSAGSEPVWLDVTVTRFHAMSFEAETRAPGGVHDIEFYITARQAGTGATLSGPQRIEASFPALTRGEMASARYRGESQKSQITAHVAATIAGWLGTGPDSRTRFASIGG